MKLKEYIEKLQEAVKANPEYAELLVVYGRDDEGNNYQKVVYDPEIGNFDGGYDGDFTAIGQFEEMGLIKEKDLNAICIN